MLLDRRSFIVTALAQGIARSFPTPEPLHRGFEDVAAKSGVRFRHSAGKTSQKYLPEAMRAGVAMLDLFFVNGAALRDPMPSGSTPAKSGPDKSDPRYWNRLFRNNGDGTFSDVTAAAGLRGEGYGMGVAVGDFNNDGRPDLYVTGLGGNHLYRNNGDGTFTDVTQEAGAGGTGWSVRACFVDYHRDGHLDLIVSRYLDWDFNKNIYCGEQRAGYRAYCHPDRFEPSSHLVFHNNGDGTFTDVSQASGIGAVPAKGLGIAINDFDRDGWPDIAIANDSFPEQLFRNNRDVTFTEVALELGLAFDEDGKTFAGMGIDFADYGNDGWPDVFVNALATQRYALFQNRTGRSFDYVSGDAGVSRITANHSGWGMKFMDYDNDGWKDLFVVQGHVMDNIELTQPSAHYREPLLLMRNRKGKFEDASHLGGDIFRASFAARGAAFGDLNNDGSVDVAISCNDGAALVLMNRGSNRNHWILLNTVGTRSNRDGIGARIRLVSGSGDEQFVYVSTGGSYASSSDKRVHFGLGRETTIRLLEITWPNAVVQRIEHIQADQILTIKEPG